MHDKASLKDSALCVFFFFLRIIALQCYSGLCHVPMQISHNYVYVYVCMYVYVYPLPAEPPSSRHPNSLSHHRVRGWASCAMQQLYASYLFHM